MTEVEQPPQNGIDVITDDEDLNRSRPADIEQDMREMERRKRVEAIMGSRLFREELERIVDSQIREGGASGILQQLSDIVGVPASRVGSVFKSSNCVSPINDIRGIESMGYSKGEKILRCKLAATFRLLDLYGWTQGLGAQITARLMADQELFLVNPFGLLYHEVTASSLNKADMQGNIVEQGTTNFGINTSHYILHTAVHAARPDIRCAIYVGCNPVVAVSSLKVGLLPLTKDSAVLGEIAIHPYTGTLNEPEEREKLIRSLGPNSKVLLLNNHGALCCGETIEEAFYAAYHIVQACETQLKLLPVGIDNLVLIPEEARKTIYDASRRPPDGFDHLIGKLESNGSGNNKDQTDNKLEQRISQQKPKWRVGGAEYEALMRMLDNAGFRTGYIYRHPLIKSDVPKPKNDIEVPPAVSSLGYLLEEEELYRQGVWKKSDLRKGGDRSRWLNSPNVYQKVEVLETGTPDPKKITKWVADGSPTHSTAVRIESAMQFVPPGTNPKEFKKLQQQIKDNRRADKISAGPQSHILEGVTWDEANRIKDANVSQTGDHVVLMGAASKGIIQRGYQHNATVYKAPYAKNPFDNVTDDELNEYKRTVTKKKSVHGEYTDTDFSESEALSSTLNTSGAQQQKSSLKKTILTTQSEPEDAAEAHVLRIETKQAPKPSQPEVVLSDADSDTHSNSLSFRKRLSSFLRATNDFISNERSHTATNKKPPTGRANKFYLNKHENFIIDTSCEYNKNFNNNYSSQIRSINNQLTTTTKQTNKFKSDCKISNNNNNNEICTKSVLTNWRELIYPQISSRNALKELSTIKTNFIREDGINSIKYDLISSDEFYSIPDNNNYDHKLIESTAPPSIYSCCDSSKIVQKFHNPYYDDACNIDDENLNIYLYGDKRGCSSKSTSSKQPFCLHSKSLNDLNNDYQLINEYYNKGENNSEPNSPLLRSPYRTVSHFGFNCPLSILQPEHKHIPITPTKYVPLKREMSYDELFSSPRYVEASEDIFNRVLKRKAFEALRKNCQNNNNNKNRNKNRQLENSPEIKRVKLSPPTLTSTTNNTEIELYDSDVNDYDDFENYDDDDDSLLDDSILQNCNTFEIDVEFLNILEKQAKLHEEIGQLKTLYDSFSLTKLDPILEEVSSDIDDELATTTSNPFEKNPLENLVDNELNFFVENNNNFSNVPTFIKKIVQMNYTEESPNLNFIPLLSNENSDINISLLADYRTPSVTELNDKLEELSLNEEEEHHGSETRIEQTKFTEKINEKNKIMSRSERCQRQEEFYELWEDHLNYYGGGVNDDSYNSDSEEFYSTTNIPNNSKDFTEKTDFVDRNENVNSNWNNNEQEEVYDSQVTISRFGNATENQEEIPINENKQSNFFNIIPTENVVRTSEDINEIISSCEINHTTDEIMESENFTKEKLSFDTIPAEDKEFDNSANKRETIQNVPTDNEIIEMENNDNQAETFEKISTENDNIEFNNYDKESEICENIANDLEMIEFENSAKEIDTFKKLPTDDEIIEMENYDNRVETIGKTTSDDNSIELKNYDKEICEKIITVREMFDFDNNTKMGEAFKNEKIELEKNDKRVEPIEKILIDDNNIESGNYVQQKEICSTDQEIIAIADYVKCSDIFIKNQSDDGIIELMHYDKQRHAHDDMSSQDENITVKTYEIQDKTHNEFLVEAEHIELHNYYVDRNFFAETVVANENIVLINDGAQEQFLDEFTTESKNDDEKYCGNSKEIPNEDESSKLINYFIESQITERNFIGRETIILKNFSKQSERIDQLTSEDIVELKNYDKPKEILELENIELKNINNEQGSIIDNNEVNENKINYDNQEKNIFEAIIQVENTVTECKNDNKESKILSENLIEDIILHEKISTYGSNNIKAECSSASSEQNILTECKIGDYYEDEQNERSVVEMTPTEDEITEIYNLLQVKKTFNEIPTKGEIWKIYSEINEFGDIIETNENKDVNVPSSSIESLIQQNRSSNHIEDIQTILQINDGFSGNSKNIGIVSDGELKTMTVNENKTDYVIPIDPDIYSSEDENIVNIYNDKYLNLNDKLNIDESIIIKEHINDSDQILKVHLNLNDIQETETLDGIQSLNSGSDSDEPSTAKISEIIDNSKNIDILSPQSINNETNYKSILVSSCNDKYLTEENAIGYCDDENSFNSIELKILQKIEENNFNKEGTIFNKIDREIRSKITPSNIEKYVASGDSDSCPSKSIPYSSTPTFLITESASYESFYSLNLSEVKAANEMRKKTKLRLKHHKATTITPNSTQESFSPTSSSISGSGTIDDKKSNTKFKKAITRNINRANNVHRAKFSRSPSPVVVTTAQSKPLNSPTTSNIVSRYSPSTTTPSPYMIKRRQRNFITENIRNVSSSSSSRSSFIERYRKGNVSAIFTKNPFGPRYSNEQRRLNESTSPKSSTTINNRKIRKSPRKLSPQQDYTIYPFQAKTTIKGSPKLWVSMSPQHKKQKKIFKPVTPINKNNLNNDQQQQIDNNNNKNDDNKNDDDNFNLLVDVACSNTNNSVAAVNTISNELENLDQATKELVKIVEKYDENIGIFSSHIAKLNENFNDCQELQVQIEDERQELRFSMAQTRRADNLTYDMLTYSISEEDD